MEIKNPCAVESFSGVLQGNQVQKYQKTYSELKSYYRNLEDLPADTIMYEVYSMPSESVSSGSLLWGLTVLNPITVSGECNMTKGHYHADESCEEYYLGQSGTGLLMYMDHDGHTWCEKVFSGSLHHISGHTAHRLINTGSEQLKVICCWPANAGHDYEAITKHPFGYRVYLKNGKVETDE
ncbi:MAG: glucose-6-phosphate isomerase [Erysipelotrichia bacterium]|nr:glucose-6-phosphate isomerase [Erysipelotrichia bacterium]